MESEYSRTCSKARELFTEIYPRVAIVPLFEAAENVLFRLEKLRTDGRLSRLLN